MTSLNVPAAPCSVPLRRASPRPEPWKPEIRQRPADGDSKPERRVICLREARGLRDPAVEIARAVKAFRQPAILFDSPGQGRLAVLSDKPEVNFTNGDIQLNLESSQRLVGLLPGLYPERLGAPAFTAACGSRFAYLVGEMARGITSSRMVVAAVRAGFVAFFGSAGLRPHAVSDAIDEIAAALGPDAAWGANLIHSPDRPEREREIVDLFLTKRVRNVSASAFMGLSKDVVRYAAAGLARGPDGAVVRRNRVFAKISRAEVAEPFMRPPPAELLRDLVAAGEISRAQAEMQAALPVAAYLTVESDSGGHTDNRPLASLFPVIVSLRDRIVRQYGYRDPIHLGAAGGLGTPNAVAAAFGLGADYVVTGSVNQSAVESGQSEMARALLCDAGLADMAMAPASDMFELGVKVQVLKRGTMFAIKAQRLYELYRRYQSVEEIPSKDRRWLETQVLRESFETAWTRIAAYKSKSDPAFAAAQATPRQKMAQVFRLFLFMGSQWAREGTEDRRADFQIWCGPAMGAFNDWVRGSFLEPARGRSVAEIGLNLLEGAAQITRAQQLASLGVRLPQHLWIYEPQPLSVGGAPADALIAGTG